MENAASVSLNASTLSLQPQTCCDNEISLLKGTQPYDKANADSTTNKRSKISSDITPEKYRLLLQQQSKKHKIQKQTVSRRDLTSSSEISNEIFSNYDSSDVFDYGH